MRGKKYSAQEREELLKSMAKRKESIAQFAKAHGVSVGTLYNWQQQAAELSPKAGSGFVEISRPISVGLGAQLTLKHGKVSMYFDQLPDTGWLTDLIEKLSR